jgi:S1-C subfamily serine protease
MKGDPSLFQISAPVQPGNSGGPVLDSKGLLIGIVVGKLNALAVAGVTDDIPQNVNFAIKSSVLENLLQSRSIAYSHGNASVPDLPITTLAEQAKGATVLVECVGP